MSFIEMIEANTEHDNYFCTNPHCHEVTTISHAGIDIEFCPSCGERYPHKISKEELTDELIYTLDGLLQTWRVFHRGGKTYLLFDRAEYNYYLFCHRTKEESNHAQ